jgi:hypothetical protein
MPTPLAKCERLPKTNASLPTLLKRESDHRSHSVIILTTPLVSSGLLDGAALLEVLAGKMRCEAEVLAYDDAQPAYRRASPVSPPR